MQGTDAMGSSGDGSNGSDDPSSQSIFSMGGTSPVVSQMLPQALSDGITQAGGLGIAHQLYLMLARSTGLDTSTGTAPGDSK
jgi:Rod binding domain-containing protein